MKKRLMALTGSFLLAVSACPQSGEETVRHALEDYFLNYRTSYTTATDRCRITAVAVDDSARTAEIFLNENFAGQSFSPDKAESVYRDVRRLLPAPYDAYTIILYGKGIRVEDLVTDLGGASSDPRKKWGQALYRGTPWVERTSLPYSVTKGMRGRHLSVWASHGLYYLNDRKKWAWQRPYLYCTTEDLFTQTIVIPYLIPMLENAGACVFTPRERDWQTNEVIVDNDMPNAGGTYSEHENKHAWENGGTGFAQLKRTYLDGENPFADGTFRSSRTVSRADGASEIRWEPDIPEPGRYAVYVSYATLPASVPDARYEVCHGGVSTTFTVNQQMGGSTWVYLGSFCFDKGQPQSNYVSLSNVSGHDGTVTADAVRFGGGMGNIARGDSLQQSVSGFPRYLEGARYCAQWSGMPYSVYSSKNGTNDYGDDINVRAFMTNHLAGGSSYFPSDSGLHVPIEMAIALHTDAGIAPGDAFIGTLGVYTTDCNDGVLAAGMSRLASRELCDVVMTQVDEDLNSIYGRWKRRQMFDRDYSETREPQVPSVILEMLSHQNFRDMALGHDPSFKFNLARAVYKGILKYTSFQHEADYVVQPLPVTCFRTGLDMEEKEIRLAWEPVQDALEPSAAPKGYVVYVKKGRNDYDNGTFVRDPRFSLRAEENVVYSFKVTAVNDGGEGFPSEELSAMIARKPLAKVLIVDGFQRVAGPQVVATGSAAGFDLSADPGVPYLCSPGFCGRQIVFGTESNPESAWGLSGNELEGKMIAGNTFDHSRMHGEAIATAGGYSFASVSRAAVEAQTVDLNEYNIVDLILGLQKNDGYSTRPYPSLTPALCAALQDFARMRGGLLVSGAYVADNQRQKESADFLRGTLKVEAYAPVAMDTNSKAEGMNTTLHLYTEPNARHYAVTHADCLVPSPEAFSTLLYMPSGRSAAVAYRGDDYRAVTLGFPFECVKYAADRNRIMDAFLRFLSAR